MNRRAVVTGLGAVTPLAIGIEPSWHALCSGVSGITRITQFDASRLPVQIAGEVKGFSPDDFIERKIAHRTGRFQQIALAAARMALEDSGFEIAPAEADRVGVVVGTAAGGVEALTGAQLMFSNGSANETSPFFIPASAILILEEMQHALARGARILAEVIGFGANADAYHVTSPSPKGEGAARCMKLALRDASISAEEVDYINAHGTSTRLNDATETQAIRTVVGEHARKLAVSSNKSMIGHLWGASGAVEAAFTVLTMKNRIIPPTINYETPDPECDLDYVPNSARPAHVRIALSNSFGFGGTNGVLVFKEFST